VNLLGDPDRRIVGAISLVAVAVCFVVGVVGWWAGWPRMAWSIAFGLLLWAFAGTYYARRVNPKWSLYAIALGAFLVIETWMTLS
jgi:uncharacterized membrane protein YfcA